MSTYGAKVMPPGRVAMRGRNGIARESISTRIAHSTIQEASTVSSGEDLVRSAADRRQHFQQNSSRGNSGNF
jgi:hypothetical protein